MSGTFPLIKASLKISNNNFEIPGNFKISVVIVSNPQALLDFNDLICMSISSKDIKSILKVQLLNVGDKHVYVRDI